MEDFKPHLACDLEESKIKFPAIVMPKIDGVRGLNIQGHIVGRSKKPFKNKFIAECYSHGAFSGVDGELALGNWTDARLCSNTTGFVNRKTPKLGKPTRSSELFWWAFDYLTEETINLPYLKRLEALQRASDDWFPEGNTLRNVAPVPWKLVESLEELLAFEEECLDAGFEGIIVRDPEGMHKSGRATVKTGAYLRLKRFIDFEGTIENLVEAKENQNEAKTNELGRSERSTHQENMVPKGMVGMIQMRALVDVVHNGKVMIAKGQLVDVGPGNMDHPQRVKAWLDFVNKTDDNLVGQIGKAKFFPKGQKDKPRFPTFISIRTLEDMSE